MDKIIKIVEQQSGQKNIEFPNFKSGDTIIVHLKIKEGNKERIQKFQGIVIKRKNVGTNRETFSVRKISNGIGVEKIFSAISQSIEKIEKIRNGSVRRSRLYYLRGKYGKSASVKEKRILTSKS
ncbi:MAG: 50S ribosomal protein L19 [Bacteroidetes bacterium]|nr:50S ribosomal protein L19 [Bacteroidota bacterium]